MHNKLRIIFTLHVSSLLFIFLFITSTISAFIPPLSSFSSPLTSFYSSTTSLSLSSSLSQQKTSTLIPVPSFHSNLLKNWNSTRIRNVSIIAHIDHGKSTICDRLLQITKTIEFNTNDKDLKSKTQDRVFDSMELERERGITIKLKACRMEYTPPSSSSQPYVLNLIDTPGHTDFHGEVLHSILASEGCILVIDSTQGIQSQTIANLYTALGVDGDGDGKTGMGEESVIVVLNKVDLPNAEVDRVKTEIKNVLGLSTSEDNSILTVSAKTGLNCSQILDRIIQVIPPPPNPTFGPLKALIFDSSYDPYKGVILFIRVVDGCLVKGDRIRLLQSKAEYDASEIGVMNPSFCETGMLRAGEVGYVTASIKDVEKCRVGDTVTLASEFRSCALHPDKYEQIEPLRTSLRQPVPSLYAGVFPSDSKVYGMLREALSKLQLSDSSLTYTIENSPSLGYGFTVGFLGMLHMDVVSERLSREFNVDVITTAPCVVYKAVKDETVIIVDSPSKMPNEGKGYKYYEPYVRVIIQTPPDYNGRIIDLCQDSRGTLIKIDYISALSNSIVYEMPLSEVINDFQSEIKSRSKGYASMEYNNIEPRISDLVRIDIMINSDIISPLSVIVCRAQSEKIGRGLVEALKIHIPPAQFKITIQSCIGSRIIAATSIPAMRKDMLEGIYGGDRSRKKKLLESQKAGKARMKLVGNVKVPQEAFLAVMKIKRGS